MDEKTGQPEYGPDPLLGTCKSGLYQLIWDALLTLDIRREELLLPQDFRLVRHCWGKPPLYFKSIKLSGGYVTPELFPATEREPFEIERGIRDFGRYVAEEGRSERDGFVLREAFKLEATEARLALLHTDRAMKTLGADYRPIQYCRVLAFLTRHYLQPVEHGPNSFLLELGGRINGFNGRHIYAAGKRAASLPVNGRRGTLFLDKGDIPVTAADDNYDYWLAALLQRRQLPANFYYAFDIFYRVLRFKHPALARRLTEDTARRLTC